MFIVQPALVTSIKLVKTWIVDVDVSDPHIRPLTIIILFTRTKCKYISIQKTVLCVNDDAVRK